MFTLFRYTQDMPILNIINRIYNKYYLMNRLIKIIFQLKTISLKLDMEGKKPYYIKKENRWQVHQVPHLFYYYIYNSF